MARKSTKKPSAWQNRIVGHGEVAPDQLLANPGNWRVHPDHQQRALAGVLREVGVVQSVIVNRQTGHLVDGHLRVALALREEQPTVPVVYVDLSPDEERVVLASLDSIAGLAGTDDALLRDLLSGLEVRDAGLADFLAGLTEDGAAALDAATSGALFDRFGVPPFSVLDARQGYWKERKAAWLALGIESERGRDDGLTFAAPGTVTSPVAQRIAASGPSTSIFDPVLCELAYRWWCPPGGVVLDPFAGGSVRGLVASRLGRRYVGIELREEQVRANEAQRAAIARAADPAPTWIVGDSREVLAAGDAEVPESVDFVFTCPPYFDLEAYSDDPADLSAMDDADFREAYREILTRAFERLRPNRLACVVVGDVRHPRTGAYRGLPAFTIVIACAEAAGLQLYNEAVLVTAVASASLRAGSHFSTSRKLAKTHQNVLVFVKGSARRASEAIGAVEFGQLDATED